VSLDPWILLGSDEQEPLTVSRAPDAGGVFFLRRRFWWDEYPLTKVDFQFGKTGSDRRNLNCPLFIPSAPPLMEKALPPQADPEL